MDNKTDLRLRAKELRKTLDIVNLSKKLVYLIQNSKEYKSAKNVMIFYPLEYEVDLRELLNDDKNFYLPRINGREIEVCPYKQNDILKISKYNLKEPVCEKVSANILDLIIVPALLVDEEGYRLGYGGGYYDRFLQNNKTAKTICLISKKLSVKNLLHEKHDIKIDLIIKI